MRVTVLLFGPERAAAGSPRVTLEVPAPATCATIMARLAAEFPSLRPHLHAGRLAINSEFASSQHAVGESDEIALIGLVSGG